MDLTRDSQRVAPTEARLLGGGYDGILAVGSTGATRPLSAKKHTRKAPPDTPWDWHTFTP